MVVKSRLINIDSGTTLLHLKAMKQQDFDTWVAELRKYQHVEVSMNLKGSASNPDLLDDSDNEGEGEESTTSVPTPQARLEKVKNNLESLQGLAKSYLPETPKSPSATTGGSAGASADAKLSVRNMIKTIGKKSAIGECISLLLLLFLFIYLLIYLFYCYYYYYCYYFLFLEPSDLVQILNLINDIVEDLTVITESIKPGESSDGQSGSDAAVPSTRKGSKARDDAKRSHRRNPSGSSFISIVSNRSKDTDVFYDAVTEIVVNSDGETSEEG